LSKFFIMRTLEKALTIPTLNWVKPWRVLTRGGFIECILSMRGAFWLNRNYLKGEIRDKTGATELITLGGNKM